MDIKHTSPLDGARERATGRTGSEAGSRPGNVAPRTGSSNPGADRVTLTDNARALLGLQPEGGSAAPLDEARIAALREAIASGRFEINAERIAESLLERERNV